MTRIAVLASGTGTNFDAIADAVRGGKLRAEIAGVLSDRPGAFVLAKARECGVPAVAVPKNPAGREAHDADMLRALDQLPGGRPQFLVMAGYMRIVTPALIRAFYDEPRGYSRIVNIHPSLLPAFPGVGGYAQAYAHGAKLAGATIHLVDEGLDSGPICAQEAFSIADCRSVSEVETLGKKLEHRLYPDTLAWVLAEKFKLEEVTEPAVHRRFHVRPL